MSISLRVIGLSTVLHGSDADHVTEGRRSRNIAQEDL